MIKVVGLGYATKEASRRRKVGFDSVKERSDYVKMVERGSEHY